MMMKRQIGLTLVAAALVAAATTAWAQDSKTFKGDNQRVGRNDLAATSGPGRALLRWWQPNAATPTTGFVLIRNNTAPAPWATTTGPWTSPGPDEEANLVFTPPPIQRVPPDPLEDAATGFAPDPGYLYTPTIAAGFGADPTVPNNALDPLATFTWRVEPADPAKRIPQSYALYVWLPSGPTDVDPGPGVTLAYPQRYFVYEVLFGTGQRWVEVIDTFVSGGGWVRIGNAGTQTLQRFPYDGVNPILVRLYNTVPRDAFGALTDNPGATVVYADAVKAEHQSGFYSASPIVGQHNAGPISTIAARNEQSEGVREGQSVTITKGVVTSYEHDNGNVRWTFSPLLESEFTVQLDNTGAGVTSTPPWIPETLAPNYRGTNYHAAPIVAALGAATTVTYAPTLEDGTYELYAWIPGDGGGEQFGTAVTYEVREGATVSTFTVNQSVNGGWVRVGNRRFAHTDSTAALTVSVLNYSAGGDVGRKAYADALRFVGAANMAINSTPVMATARVRTTTGGAPALTDVVVVATENGRLYCLDALGNGDGTTNVYWTYPSTPDPDNTSWTDPNQVAGFDGPNGIAEMPIGFDLSSALVQTVSPGGVPEDRLYIGSRNGRVYSINMDGRGDVDLARRVPGTTTRAWTYPNDYPAPVQTSLLGPIEGSVVFADVPSGPTLYVPTTQGRMFALDAIGVAGTRTTSVRWQYPAPTDDTLGAIRTTPAIEFGNIYFGTDEIDGAQDPRGQLIALDADTGTLQWVFDGTAAFGAGDFRGSPITVPAALMAPGAMPDTVFAANENLFVYAVRASDGALLWSSDELGTGVSGALSFTPMSVLDNTGTGTRIAAPMVLVPTADGRFSALFARDTDVNRFGTKRGYEFITGSDSLTASLAVGRSWMYGGDMAGNLFAFDNDTFNTGYISPGNPPGQQTVVENDASGDVFRNAKIKFVNKDTYQLLRANPPALTYAETIDPAREVTRLAFDWGETLYILVYDFPYQIQQIPPPNGATTPPIVNYSFATEGAAIRNLAIESKLFSGSSPNTPDSGYTVIAYSLQGGGANALPPGRARVSATISTTSLSNPARAQTIALDPANSIKEFGIGNPLALAMAYDPASGAPLAGYGIGYSPDASLPENLVNGSPDVAATGAREDRLLSSTGLLSHGQAGTSRMVVYDRSMMTLILGPGRGLSNVRVARDDLHWRNPSVGLSVVKPLPPLLFPNYEDLPVNRPNGSIDYPDMKREVISVTKDPLGIAENPVFSPVSLKPPLNVDENAPLTRTLVPTLMDFQVAVPKFQPANLLLIPDSTGSNEVGGYAGRVQVYVDANGNGRLEQSGRREAFRSFTLGSGVGIDEAMSIPTPTLDLGPLAAATGYSPIAPYGLGTPFSPWAGGAFNNLFTPFRVFNDGNVNMLNVRLAHASDVAPGSPQPWPIFASGNHELAWLDSQWYVWSDIDPVFALTSQVIIQKSRVGDRVSTELLTNPRYRDNQNLGVVGGTLLPGPTPAPPRVAVTPPLGMPAGTYSQIMRVIEDRNNDLSLALDNTNAGLEPYTDPTMNLVFKVRETRLTNNFTTNTAPMVDDPSVIGVGSFQHKNAQPAAMRDLNGNLILAFASNRPAFNALQPPAASLVDAWRLYVGSVRGATPSGGVGSSPLGDLGAFTPASNSQWVSQQVGAYPSAPTPDVLFDAQPGETILGNSVKFQEPAFPAHGLVDPFSGAAMTSVYLAFIGDAVKQTPAGLQNESRVMLASTTVAADGTVSLGAPIVMPNDPRVQKGNPSLVQSGGRAVVFFTLGGTGQSQIAYASYDPANPLWVANGGWSRTNTLPLGAGFESATSPSITGRTYRGVAASGLSAGASVGEITFVGKLRGRASSDVFYGRVRLDLRGGAFNAVFLGERPLDRMTATGEPGEYQTGGVEWDPRSGIGFYESINGGPLVDIEVAGTREYDRETNTLSFDTKLGGKAIVDLSLGRLRFSSATLPQGAELRATYTPRYVRISGANRSAGHSSPTVLFDNRLIGEYGYWARPNNVAIAPSDPVRPARLVFAYGRGASGEGQTARPYMRTARFGIQLPTGVHTQPNGTLTNLQVVGATGFYQVDPAGGRVYFTDVDENRSLTVNYTGIDPSTGAQLPGLSVSAPVGLVPEREEVPLPIDQAVNETQLTAFLDPFDPAPVAQRRPGLIWMFYTSTRAGGPDLYFQTIAPRFTPLPSGR